MRVAIIGAGGHAKVVWDILVAAGHQPVGFVDNQPTRDTLLGLPVVTARRALPAYDGLVIAIGNNQVRKAIFEKLAGETFVNAIHPSATLARHVTLGRGVMVAAGVVVNIDTTIGDNTILNTGATVDHDNAIGPHAHVAPGCHLAGNVTVGEGAFLGIGTCAIPGIEVGAWATCGAGSVLVRPVPPGAKVIGVPARPR
jgi:sugar O-acyltransferase (sialic acid O-acetyltransferase NeuD family)